jgi:hypothetical protein
MFGAGRGLPPAAALQQRRLGGHGAQLAPEGARNTAAALQILARSGVVARRDHGNKVLYRMLDHHAALDAMVERVEDVARARRDAALVPFHDAAG